MPQLKLTFFDAPGRAEPVRVALRLAGVPFEDVRLAYPAFAAAKAAGQLPLGSVPVLEVDGVRFAETAAMLRYAARLGDTGLIPADPLRELIVESALDAFNDTFSRALLPSLFERDPEKKRAMRAELAAGPMARVFRYVDDLVGLTPGPFLGGEALSIADLVVALQVRQILAGGLDGLDASHLAPYPRLVALTEAYAREPRIAALG